MQSSSERTIPLFRPSFNWHEARAMEKVLDGGYLNEGPFVREAEKDFAKYVGAKHCILVPNGALALFLASAHKMSKTEDPIWGVPSFYGVFAANAVLMAQGNPHILDVDRHTAVIKGNPKNNDALHWSKKIIVHANGRIADSAPASNEIEDCAQAIFHHSSTDTTLSCYSFHSTKMITAGGIGGAVCCDNDDDYYCMYAMKDHGRPERAMGQPVPESHQDWGTNLKFSDINAAFFIEQLKKLTDRRMHFTKCLHLYKEFLGSKVSWLDGDPAWRIDCLVDQPDDVIARLAKHGIEAKRFYLPTHMQPQFKGNETDYPNSAYLYSKGLYLPSSSTLSEEDIQYVCEKLLEVL